MLIDGKAVAQQVEAEVRQELAKLGFAPNLIVIRVGNDKQNAGKVKGGWHVDTAGKETD